MVNNVMLFLIILLWVSNTTAQELVEILPIDTRPKLSLYANSYPIGVNDEVFKNFRLDYMV